MLEMDWATGALRVPGVVEMDIVTGSIYLGGPGVDSFHHMLHHLISHPLIIYKLQTLLFPAFALTCSV